MPTIQAGNKIYRLNLKESPPNIFQPKYNLLLPVKAPTLPPFVNLAHQMPPIFFQGDTGSCSSQAISGVLEYIQLLNTRKNAPLNPEAFGSLYEPLSKMFLYFNERLIDGTTLEDAGSSLSSGTTAINTYGICRESIWQYDETMTFEEPSEEAYTEAAKHRSIRGYMLNGSPYELKYCLASGYPFAFGIYCYDSFLSETVASSGIVPIPKLDEKIQGGHALCAIGYDEESQTYSFRNSWGDTWGERGHGEMPYAYMHNPKMASSFWTYRP